MSVEHLEVLVEERSMATALRELMPQLVGAATWQVYEYRSKEDLLKKLSARLRGYSSWLPKTWRIVVLLDRDDDDCQELKARLEKIACDANLTTKSTPNSRGFSVVNRLAIEELEAWFFGDWEAVRKAFPKVNGNIPRQKRYRNPDAIKGGTWEAFERVLKAAGYFKTGLRKIEAARAVAIHMIPCRNTSRSFQVFRSVVSEMTTRRQGRSQAEDRP